MSNIDFSFVHEGVDVYIFKYGLLKPVKAMIMTCTGQTAIAAAYAHDGSLETGCRHVIRFGSENPSAVQVFRDYSGAVSEWNRLTWAAINEMTEHYKANLMMLEGRIIDVPGEAGVKEDTTCTRQDS